MIIDHGVPEHKYFAIAVPRGTAPKISEENPTPGITLKNPKSFEKQKVVMIDKWVMTIDDLYYANAFCLLTYGVSSKILHNYMKGKFSNLKEIEFLLLKKVTE